jgi:Na+(H+)/acetate symporter ActP
MKPIRAIVFGVFLWLLMFFLLSSLKFVFKINYPSSIYFLVYFAFFLLFTILCILGYFWVPKMKGGFVHGLVTGLIFLVLIVILHLVVVVPFVAESMFFIYRVDTLVSFLFIILISILVGLAKN